MKPTHFQHVATTLTPFLYPSIPESLLYSTRPFSRIVSTRRSRCYSTAPREDLTTISPLPHSDLPPGYEDEHSLDPSPESYSSTPFADRCSVMLHAGAGGHGCVSFLREKFIPDGPPNGGDGGTGGSVYIQAVRNETSLHKLARRREAKAGRGRNGQGKMRGGERGADLLITVPVGTVVREIWRRDPLKEELDRRREDRVKFRAQKAAGEDPLPSVRPEKWLVFPGTEASVFQRWNMPKLPEPQRSPLAHSAPKGPIRLDLDSPMERPMLLIPGSVGGLGNTHFVSRELPRPVLATRGQDAISVALHLELKLLADVGLVGLPNAGKSTLLRALSNSRTRIGNWAFTTLKPNIGTVVLDNHRGRPRLVPTRRASDGGKGEVRENFTIADIPGLIEDAHLDKGLGMSFLRHVERAAMLAFVVDLSGDTDPVTTLKSLWREVGEYETLRSEEINAETQRSNPPMARRNPFDDDDFLEHPTASQLQDLEMEPLPLPPISAKPWFVVATKADQEGTQERFAELRAYVEDIEADNVEHPGGRKNAWRKRVDVVPVSAIRGGVEGGAERVKDVVVRLMEDEGL
ncbi:uncharacterized protein IWZ02DRAFT_456408 [Phyllosticta citriasiana]|uniref:GTP-binding protein Obg/CgtA n=1 Tax=Phyllosticta citriasiana TaxID=595635 RepID=A0ABR1KXM0_9PEZI